MKTKASQIVKAICFCLVAVLMVNFINGLFKPKFLENRWKFTKTTHCFYDLDNNSIDVAFLGTSQMAAAIDPLQIYEERGITSYNLGIMSQPIQATYFWLKEVKKTQDIKLAVIEVKAMARKGLKVEAKARRSYDYMRFGLNKLNYAWEFNESQDKYEDTSGVNLKEYLFPLVVYHSRWSSLEYDDYDYYLGNNETDTRGLATLTTRFKNHSAYSDEDYEDGKYDGLTAGGETELEDVHDSIIEYDNKLIEYAKENGIELLFIKTPDSSWNIKQYNFVKKLADENGIDYIDFNLSDMMEEIDFDFLEDEADTVHVNISGAKKISEYVGEYIADKYEITDYRNVEGNVRDEIEAELPDYYLAMRDANLSFNYDFYSYAKEVAENDDYSVIVAGGSGTYNFDFSDSDREALLMLGVKDDIYEETKYGACFISVLNGDDKRFSYKEQNSSKKESIYEGGSYADGTDFAVTVTDKNCEYRINNKNHPYIEPDKLSIIVYNNKLHEIADTAYLYEGYDGVMMGRKELFGQ